MTQLRQETEEADAIKKKKAIEEQNPGFGYGGKFGVETDRMDKSAMGHDYIGKVDKHASQKDYSDGFGGKFGVQSDRVDKSALSWDHKEKVQKHSSQKDYSDGFGGKFGVQNDRVDKSALGWDHIEKVEKHESQKGKIIIYIPIICGGTDYLHLQITVKDLEVNLAFRKTVRTNQR